MTCRIFFFLSMLLAGPDPWQQQRVRMVKDQIEERGVRQPRVLRAMRETPRHLFVPPQIRNLAYNDSPLPIGHGQTISQPYIVALMTELADPARDHKVLEIGTGSGYQAAVLAPLTRHVYTIEVVKELAATASRLLRELGHANITVRHGDGYKGWPEEAPFDRIVLTAAPPEVPAELLRQLREGGRLVAPVGRSAMDQELIVIDKSPAGKLSRRSVLPVRFVPMVPGR